MRLTFEQLKSAIEEAGFRASKYSGRAMYGSYCIGVVVDDFRDLGSVIGSLRDPKEDADLGEGSDFYDGVSMASQVFEDLRTDNMGLSMIVYWPRIKWPEGVEEEREEDEDEDYE